MSPHAGIVATYPPNEASRACGRRGLRPSRGDGALAIVSANRPPEISQFPRNARRRGRRRYGKSPNAIGNRKSKNRKFSTTSASVATMPFSVERELDPPASASGRRELRPSRDTWRWRPRHRICQPPSRNQSIPAQRTTTGASSPRQILKCQNGQTQSQIENHESQIPTANCQLPTAS